MNGHTWLSAVSPDDQGGAEAARGVHRGAGDRYSGEVVNVPHSAL